VDPAAVAAAAGATRDTTVDEAAQRLANELRAIPGIERFGEVRLSELDRAGPRPLRTMWRVAREQLNDRYGSVTIGEILDRYSGRGGPHVQA
jgi:nucleotidyltransferase/DNA polymerase involved in DNA repair